jgi:hypothetical protein
MSQYDDPVYLQKLLDLKKIVGNAIDELFVKLDCIRAILISVNTLPVLHQDAFYQRIDAIFKLGNVSDTPKYFGSFFCSLTIGISCWSDFQLLTCTMRQNS